MPSKAFISNLNTFAFWEIKPLTPAKIVKQTTFHLVTYNSLRKEIQKMYLGIKMTIPVF